MKRTLKMLVFEISHYLELMISIILAIVIFIMSIQFFMDISNTVLFGQTKADLNVFLGQAMTLAVGVEFIKMLCKHSPSTVIEVLLFAIARQMVVEHMQILDMLIGVVAIAALFATRKYLFCRFDETDHMILRANQKTKTANLLAKVSIPLEEGDTLKEVIVNHLKKNEQNIAVGTCVYIKDIALRIDDVKNGEITRVEVIRTI